MTEPASRPPSAQAPTDRPTLTRLLRDRVLDPELGALVWLLLEARVPLLVAGGRRPATRVLEPERLDRTQLLGALLDLLPSTARRIRVDATGTGLDRLTSSDAATAWLTGLDLDANAAPGVRLAFRSLSRGAVMAASIAADSLEAVFERLRAPDLRLTDDELTFLGVVLILRTFEPRNDAPAAPATPPTEPVERVVAAHYVRPLARDPAGHVQRPAPAVLATWEPRTDAFEHFAWGVAADLAGRAGLRPGDLDLELERRRSYLAGLVEAGLVGSNELRSALDGYRLADSQDSMG